MSLIPTPSLGLPILPAYTPAPLSGTFPSLPVLSPPYAVIPSLGTTNLSSNMTRSKRVYPQELEQLIIRSPQTIIKPVFPVELLTDSSLTEGDWYTIYQKYFQDPTQEGQTPLGLKMSDLPYDPRYPFVEIDVKTGHVSKSMPRFPNWYSLVNYLATVEGSDTNDNGRIERIIAFGLYDQLFKFLLEPGLALQDPLAFFDKPPHDIRKPPKVKVNLNSLVAISLLNGHRTFCHLLVSSFHHPLHVPLHLWTEGDAFPEEIIKVRDEFNFLLIQAGYIPNLELIRYYIPPPHEIMSGEVLNTIHFNRLEIFIELMKVNHEMIALNDQRMLIDLIRYRRKEFFTWLSEFGYFSYTDENLDDMSSSLQHHFAFYTLVEFLIICNRLKVHDMIPFLTNLLPEKVIDEAKINLDNYTQYAH